MDVNRLSQGEKIVGISAIVLLLDMFILKWFGLKFDGGAGAFGVSAEGSKNAWGSMDVIRFILILAVIAGLALTYIKAAASDVDLPVALSVVVTALAGLGTLLVLFRLISPPDFGLSDFPSGVSHTRGIGAFIGLIAVGALTYGGYRTMEEEGTSFGDAADSFSGGGSGGTGAGPGAGSPPPPPPPPPPPSGGEPPSGGGAPPA